MNEKDSSHEMQEADRSYAQAGPDALGRTIAGVYLGMVGAGLDADTARVLTQDWIWTQFGRESSA